MNGLPSGPARFRAQTRADAAGKHDSDDGRCHSASGVRLVFAAPDATRPDNEQQAVEHPVEPRFRATPLPVRAGR
jgi:hypothetical protein